MKELILTVTVTTVLAGSVGAVEITAVTPVVGERGPHHRVWNRSVTETLPNGKTMERVSSFTEIGSGLNKRSETGEWVDANETIEIVNGIGIARGSQHQVIFNADIHSGGSIDMQTTDGKRLRSNILGISWFNGQQNVLISEVKRCIGDVVAPNKVAYQDAFNNYSIAVVYTYSRGGFEQDVIIKGPIPLPQDFGLNPEACALEIYTEFLDPPEPIKTTKQLTLRQPRAGRPGLEIVSESLDFGEMMIPMGRAFPFTDNGNRRIRGSVPVATSWQVIDGRTFLIESIPYPLIAKQLQALGQAAAVPKGEKVAFVKKSIPKIFPPRQVANIEKREPMRLAAAPLKREGYVIDYAIVATLANTRFRADTTYFVNSSVYLSGNTIFEGGTIIKFATTNSAPMEIAGPVECLSGPYRPIIITSQQDSSVGENLYAAGGPTNYASAIDCSAEYLQLRHMRISYADIAIHTYAVNLSHSQIIHCGSADSAFQTEEGGACNLDNVLLYDIGKAFDGSSYQANLRHVTVNKCNLLTTNWDGDPNLSIISFTNSLLVDVADGGLVFNEIFAASYWVSGASNVFTTVGAGAHYLQTNSPYRNAGTVYVPSWLRDDLGRMTTYPPVVLTNEITTNTILGPIIQRDNDTYSDVGFHYEAVDYAMNAKVSSSLTVQPGTCIAGFGPSGIWNAWPFTSSLTANGKASNPIKMVWYNTIQEQASTNWASTVEYGVVNGNFSSLTCRFVDFSELGGNRFVVAVGGSDSFIDCQINGGMFFSESPSISIRNCLLNRVATHINDENYNIELTASQNTFFGGTLMLTRGQSSSFELYNNVFDKTLITSTAEDYADYNGYVTNNNANFTNTMRLATHGAHDVIQTSSTNIAWETIWQRRWCLPTNSIFINKGSATADNFGLFHFTCTTNQVKETNSIVDLGFHFVALNSSGQPIDSDSDGLADVDEDLNGNGVVNTGETNFSNPDSDGDGVDDYVEVAQGRDPNQSGWLPDWSGLVNLETFTPRR